VDNLKSYISCPQNSNLTLFSQYSTCYTDAIPPPIILMWLAKVNSATAQNITRDRSLHSIMISCLNPSSVIHYGSYTYNKCNTTCIMTEHLLSLLCNLHVSIGYIPTHYWHRYLTPLGCGCFLRNYNRKSYNQRNMHSEGFWDMLMCIWANGSCHFEGSSSRPSNPREMTFTQ
jgi:hypothetical protein